MGIFSNNNGKKSNEMSVNVSSKGVNVIAPETHFKGVIETSAMTQIEGFFEGDVKCENTLHIGGGFCFHRWRNQRRYLCG